MKPMLASATDGVGLQYPLIVSPKLDGVRCLVINGTAMSRSLKPIPNKFVQILFGRTSLNGLDGELIVGSPNAEDVYQKTTSGVMSVNGTPNVVFHVFDDFNHDEDTPFIHRFRCIEKRIRLMKGIKLVRHVKIMNEKALLAYEASVLADGYEGVMIRSVNGPYKYGRSTLNEGWLLKLKRFEDSEAEILDVVQLMHNDNEAKRNELGQLERSSRKEGKVPLELLGAFIVRDLKTGIKFEIGTGFTAAERHLYWVDKCAMVGKLVKYKSQTIGVKDKPRFPVFLGLRDHQDL